MLGLREFRKDPVSLGGLASAEANGQESWAAETYAYGPLSLGITAAAVNEAAQHCEDLFALLRFLREPMFFAREMGGYNAGKVVAFGRRLADANDATISRLFVVPDQNVVRDGMAEAEDPSAAASAVEEGRARLGDMVRETAAFYCRYEDVHVQYKHGLKLPLRPFGVPTAEAITDRRSNVKAPLFFFGNEPISQIVKRPPGEMMMAFQLGETQRTHLVKLVDERNVLQLRLAHDVDLDEVVERCYVVSRLLQMASANRLSLGEVDDGVQRFQLPGPRQWEMVDVVVKLDRVLSLEDFVEPTAPRAAAPKEQHGRR